MECPTCGGSGCTDCRGKGKFDLAVCPLDFVTADVWDAIRAAELFRKGLPPIAGGVLDQAAEFVEAARFIWAEQDRCRAELKLRPIDSD